jgi:hypothetical protein
MFRINTSVASIHATVKAIQEDLRLPCLGCGSMILVITIPTTAGIYAPKISNGANRGCFPLYISGKKGIHKPHDIAKVKTKKATT